MANLTRRGLLKFGGGAGAGGVLLSASKALGLSKITPPASLGLGGMVEQAERIMPSTAGPPTENMFHVLLRQMEAGRGRRYSIRQERDIDPDIQCLKSVSPVMKRHMQFARNVQEEDLFEKVRKLAYPHMHTNSVTDDGCVVGQAAPGGY